MKKNYFKLVGNILAAVIFVVLMFLYIDRAVNDSAETNFMVLNIINVIICVVFIIRSIISSIKVIKCIRDSK